MESGFKKYQEAEKELVRKSTEAAIPESQKKVAKNEFANQGEFNKFTTGAFNFINGEKEYQAAVAKSSIAEKYLELYLLSNNQQHLDRAVLFLEKAKNETHEAMVEKIVDAGRMDVFTSLNQEKLIKGKGVIKTLLVNGYVNIAGEYAGEQGLQDELSTEFKIDKLFGEYLGRDKTKQPYASDWLVKQEIKPGEESKFYELCYLHDGKRVEDLRKIDSGSLRKMLFNKFIKKEEYFDAIKAKAVIDSNNQSLDTIDKCFDGFYNMEEVPDYIKDFIWETEEWRSKYKLTFILERFNLDEDQQKEIMTEWDKVFKTQDSNKMFFLESVAKKINPSNALLIGWIKKTFEDTKKSLPKKDSYLGDIYINFLLAPSDDQKAQIKELYKKQSASTTNKPLVDFPLQGTLLKMVTDRYVGAKGLESEDIEIWLNIMKSEFDYSTVDSLVKTVAAGIDNTDLWDKIIQQSNVFFERLSPESINMIVDCLATQDDPGKIKNFIIDKKIDLAKNSTPLLVLVEALYKKNKNDQDLKKVLENNDNEILRSVSREPIKKIDLLIDCNLRLAKLTQKKSEKEIVAEHHELDMSGIEYLLDLVMVELKNLINLGVAFSDDFLKDCEIEEGNFKMPFDIAVSGINRADEELIILDKKHRDKSENIEIINHMRSLLRETRGLLGIK